jgi:putative ABC transport system substrate-binding protein
MRRREIFAGVGAFVVSGLLLRAPVRAQQAGHGYRLGVLVTTASSLDKVKDAILPELARLGYVAGRNLVLELRAGELGQLPELARELVGTAPDAILALSTPAVAAARGATDRIPIVSYGPDLVALGLAASTARPGGNVTGISILATEIEPKRLLVLAEAVPNVRRFGVMFHQTIARREIVLPALAEAAHERGLSLVLAEIAATPDFTGAFERFRAEGVEALLVTAHSVLWNGIGSITSQAQVARLPTMCEWMDIADKDCVFGYGPRQQSLYKRAANMIGQIFGGAAPGSIPVESPSQIGLAVNIKAARAIGLTIPPTILARADEVIE